MQCASPCVTEKKEPSVTKKSVGDVIATLGVIGSLLFVGFEIRQNNVALRAAAIQASTEVARQQIQMFALDADANRINMIGHETPEALSEEEKSRYRWIVLSFLWGMQGQYHQWSLGVLSDDDWSAWNRVICDNVRSPGMSSVWAESGDIYAQDFREIVEACLR